MPVYHFPSDLEQIISARAREEGDAGTSAVAASIRRLSDLFNGKEPWDPRYARDPALRRAYLEYFLPVNLPKVRAPLARWLATRPDRWTGRPLRVLDLGSGPATALLGLCDLVRDLPPLARPSELDLAAIDLSPENLRDGEWCLRAFAAAEPALPPLRLRSFRLDLFSDRTGLLPLVAAGGRFDLVLAANVLCELVRGPDGLDRAERLVRTVAADALEPGGAIVLIEPGLRETSRDLHRLRDRLLAGPAGDPHRLAVHAPCLHQEACPALARQRDWCRTDLAWRPPAGVAELDRATGLRKGSLKFAYLVLSREPPRAPAPGEWRVVSDLLDLKGERRVVLCGDGRWIVLGQLKRERGEGVDAFRSLRRGDLVRVEGMEPRGAIWRLPPTGRIRTTAEGPGVRERPPDTGE